MKDRAIKNEDGSITVTMPIDAVRDKHDRNFEERSDVVLVMPRGQGCDSFLLVVPGKNISKNNDDTIDVTFSFDSNDRLPAYRYGDGMDFSADELIKVYNAAADSNFVPKDVYFKFPSGSVFEPFPGTMYVNLPNSCEYSGQRIFLSTEFLNKKNPEPGCVKFSVPDYTYFSLTGDDGRQCFVSAIKLADRLNGKIFDSTATEIMGLPYEALVKRDRDATAFKMPADGEYAGYIYTVANSSVHDVKPFERREGGFVVQLPENKNVWIYNPLTSRKDLVPATVIADENAHKTAKDYDYGKLFADAAKARSVPARASNSVGKTR